MLLITTLLSKRDLKNTLAVSRRGTFMLVLMTIIKETAWFILKGMKRETKKITSRDSLS